MSLIPRYLHIVYRCYQGGSGSDEGQHTGSNKDSDNNYNRHSKCKMNDCSNSFDRQTDEQTYQ